MENALYVGGFEMEQKTAMKISMVSIVGNILLSLFKALAGIVANSGAMISDAIHSASDVFSTIVVIIGIRLSGKESDKEHPYGHKKSEIIASMFIGCMLLFLGLKTLFNGFTRFVNPQELNITLISLISLILTICINVFVTMYERKKGEEYNSFILISDSIHTKSDIFISIGVLVSLIGIKFGLPKIIDPIISITISLFILKACYEIFKESIGVLLDRAVIEEEKIIDVLNSFSEIKDIHKIRSRGSENEIYVDMHIMINANTTTEQAHELSHNIEREIKNRINPNCQVIIHIEPYHKKENVL